MRAWWLLVGDWHRAEFAAAQQWLASQQPALCCPTVDAACRRLADTPSMARLGTPAAIVLAQSWPGQIDHRQIDALHAAAPLARLVGLVGPWSEGSRRGDEVWPGVEVIPWHAWQWRLPAALGKDPTLDGECEAIIPKTATAQERIVHRLMARCRLKLASRLIAIISSDPLSAEGLAAMVEALGLRAASVGRGQPLPNEADAVLVDGWPAGGSSGPRAWPATDGRHTCAPHFLVLAFPRWDDVRRAEALGFAEVLAKPLLLADLAAALAAHLPPGALR